MPDIRRHSVLLSDREIVLVEYALLAYAALIRIKTGSPVRQEADNTARIAAVIQHHRNCTCPTPVEEGTG